jgi:hypothetical protein
MSPSSTLVDTTPNEVQFCKKPSVAHLKVFGCDKFLHAPKEKRRKLDKKEVKCIFIRYKKGMKGYKLWNFSSRKTMYNQDVVFREVGRKSNPDNDVQTENDTNTMGFELSNEEDDLAKLTESKE